jgi:hypothetical protein
VASAKEDDMNSTVFGPFILILALSLAGVSSAQSIGAQVPARSRSSERLSNAQFFTRIPMRFEANQGQMDPNTHFVSRGPGYAAFLTSGGMVLSLRPVAGMEATVGGSNRGKLVKRTTLKFNLLGAAQNPVVIGEQQLSGRVNYFLGKDRRRWRTNVPIYSRVRYKNVYPGIDLVYYGHGQQLEYDFEVAAGANPNLIRFEVQGANQADLNNVGELILQTEVGDLRFQSPLVYQQENGRKRAVEGGYVLDDATHVSFRLGAYDTNKAVVIDPVLLYATYFGGNGSDQASGIAVDSAGSIYLAGSTDSTDLPGMSVNMGCIAFLAKFDPSGSTLIYEDYWGGFDGSSFVSAFALDATNNAYVTGSTDADDFPTTTNNFQSALTGNKNGFLTEVSANGRLLVYSTYFGGSGSDWPSGVALDSAGDVYIAGSTSSQNFPITPNAFQSRMSANQAGQYGVYGFATKFNKPTDLNPRFSLAYSTYLGGSSMAVQSCGGSPCWFAPVTYINGLAVDSFGNAYLAGITDTSDFPTSDGAYITTASLQQNAPGVGFVTQLTSTGALGYSTYLYGASGAQTDIEAIAVDSSGSAYVTGQTSDGTFPVTSTTICDPSGASCGYAFVTKFVPDGSKVAYSTFLGPNNSAAGYHIAVDSSNNAYVLGMALCDSFTTVNSIQDCEDITTTDILLVEIDPIGSSQLFATYLGGKIGNEYPEGIALDTSGNIYVSGTTFSTDFPVTLGSFQTALDAAPDAFVLKIGPAEGAAVTASPSSLQFTPEPIGSTSASNSILIRNMGSRPLVISSISATGNFSESNDCGTSLLPASNCTVTVSFTPAGPGTRTGSILIADDAVSGSSQAIPLSGYGSGPAASLGTSNLIFPNTAVGSPSPAQPVTLTNSGDAALSISGIQVSDNFSQTNTCPASLSAGSNCTISVSFTPAISGTSTGTLSVLTDAAISAPAVTLSGDGTDFSLAISQLQATMSSSGTASFSLSLSPLGGAFTSPIQLSCSGAPLNSVCNVTPSSITPGASPATVLVGINTTLSRASALPSGSVHPFQDAWLQLESVAVIGGVLFAFGQRGKKVVLELGVALLVIALLFLCSCAGPMNTARNAGPPAPPPGSYTITVTASCGTLHHSLPLTLIVQ